MLLRADNDEFDVHDDSGLTEAVCMLWWRGVCVPEKSRRVVTLVYGRNRWYIRSNYPIVDLPWAVFEVEQCPDVCLPKCGPS